MPVNQLLIALIVALMGVQVASAQDRYLPSSDSPGSESVVPPIEANEANAGQQPPFQNSLPAGSLPPSATADPQSPATSTSPPLERSVLPAAPTAPPSATGNSSPLNGFQRPGDFQSGGNAGASQPAGPRPSVIMLDIMKPPHDSQLVGTTIPLIDVLAGAGSRAEQARRIDEYWDLCASIAEYYLALRQRVELQRLGATGLSAGATWQQASAALAARIDAAQRAARASQLRLAAYLGRGADQLPLPADMPHCGPYHSRYEEIFIGRPSVEAEELAALLPLRYGEMKQAAIAAAQADELLDVAARSDRGDGTSTLQTLEVWTERRRALVHLVRDYNRRIARYAELAAPGEIPPERLLSMLIKSQYTSMGAPAMPTAPLPSGQSGVARGVPPRTFADGEGWEPASLQPPENVLRDEAVRPASGEATNPPRRERSLLVPRG